MSSYQYVRTNDVDEDADMDERRRQPRRAVLIRADVQIPGKPAMKAHAVDLSQGGIGLQSPVEVAIDQEIVVTLPFDVCGEQRTVVLTGRVRYCTKQSDRHYRIGLQFVHQNADAAAFVAAVCG